MSTPYERTLLPILAELPAHEHDRARRMVNDVIYARREVNVVRAIDALAHEFESEWPEAVAKLNDHRARLLARSHCGSLEHNVHFPPLLEKVLGDLPEAKHERATEMVGDILLAGTKANTIRAIDAFTCEFEQAWPEATAKLVEGTRDQVAFFDLSVEQVSGM